MTAPPVPSLFAPKSPGFSGQEKIPATPHMVRQGFALGALLILFALLGAAHAAVHAGHVLRLVGHWTLGHARGGARHGIHGFDSADVFIGLVLIEVTRQLHDLSLIHI